MKCYLVLSSVTSLAAAQALCAATCVFNIRRTPVPLITALCSLVADNHRCVYTSNALALLSPFHFKLSSCVAHPTRALPQTPRFPIPISLIDSDRKAQQVEICLSQQVRRKEIGFSTCNFKQLSSHLSGQWVQFPPAPPRSFLWQKRNTSPGNVTCEQSRRALTFDKRPERFCIIELPSGPRRFHLRHGQESPQDRLLI